MERHNQESIWNAHTHLYIVFCTVHSQRNTCPDTDGRKSIFGYISHCNWKRNQSVKYKRDFIHAKHIHLMCSRPILHRPQEPLHKWPHSNSTLHGATHAFNNFDLFSTSEHLTMTLWPHGESACTISKQFVASQIALQTLLHLCPQLRFFVHGLLQNSNDGSLEHLTRTICWHSSRNLLTMVLHFPHSLSKWHIFVHRCSCSHTIWSHVLWQFLYTSIWCRSMIWHTLVQECPHGNRESHGRMQPPSGAISKSFLEFTKLL